MNTDNIERKMQESLQEQNQIGGENQEQEIYNFGQIHNESDFSDDTIPTSNEYRRG
jgi:hypothetical protein